MTIIWAKKIKDKRNLFTDDALSIWEKEHISASQNYRRKLRDLPRASHYTLVASAWTCRESDVIHNLLDKRLWENKYNTSLELLDLIQEIVMEWCKMLKEVDEENPSFNLLLLDVELNTVYFIEEFSVRILSDNVELVAWSWQYIFHKIHKKKSLLIDEDKFKSDFILASSLSDSCAWPIFQSNWEDFYTYDEEWNVLAHRHLNLE